MPSRRSSWQKRIWSNAALKDLLKKIVALTADHESPIKLAGGFFPKPARGGHPIENKI
jgi:hypothetical protein